MNRLDLYTAMFRGMAGGANDPSSRMASHMPALYVLTREWSLGHVVELGVGNGWSTVALPSREKKDSPVQRRLK